MNIGINNFISFLLVYPTYFTNNFDRTQQIFFVFLNNTIYIHKGILWTKK